MAASKAELESAWQCYDNAVQRAEIALAGRKHMKAIEFAVSAWPFIDGMIQYSKRYLDGGQFESLRAFEIVFAYAPVTFDSVSLDALEALLKTQRRIDKSTVADEPAQLEEARAVMRDARRLWNLIEGSGVLDRADLRVHLAEASSRLDRIVDAWIDMRLLFQGIESGATLLSFVTQMEAVVPAKCPNCGIVVRRSKRAQLEILACGSCQGSTSPVLLA